MSRNRPISADVWARQAVIDRTPMAGLPFLGLRNFADDLGAQPLRPRTIKKQVFPAMRSMPGRWATIAPSAAIRASAKHIKGLWPTHQQRKPSQPIAIRPVPAAGLRDGGRHPPQHEGTKTVQTIAVREDAPLEWRGPQTADPTMTARPCVRSYT